MPGRKPAVTPESVPLDGMADQFKTLHKLRREIAKREAAEKLIVNQIKAALGDSPRGTIGGQDAVLWTRTQRTNVDVPKLREKYPDIADSCIKIVEVRSFRIVDPA